MGGQTRDPGAVGDPERDDPVQAGPKETDPEESRPEQDPTARATADGAPADGVTVGDCTPDGADSEQAQSHDSAPGEAAPDEIPATVAPDEAVPDADATDPEPEPAGTQPAGTQPEADPGAAVTGAPSADPPGPATQVRPYALDDPDEVYTPPDAGPAGDEADDEAEDLGPVGASPPLADDLLVARTSRRRQRRQTLTFFAAFLAVLMTGVGALAHYQGMWEWPFSETQVSQVVPCETSSLLLAPKDISLRVYNASTRQGLALRVTRDLQVRGFEVADTGNDPLGAKVKPAAVLRYGPNGEAATHTVAAHVRGKVTLVQDDRLSETVDLVLGQSFGLKAAPDVKKALAKTAKALGRDCENSARSTTTPGTPSAPPSAPGPTPRPTAPTTAATG